MTARSDALLHCSKLTAQQYARSPINCALWESVLTVYTDRRYTVVFRLFYYRGIFLNGIPRIPMINGTVLFAEHT